VLFGGAALVVTIAAIDRSAGAGLKGHLSLFAAFTTGHGVQLTGGLWRKGVDPFFFYRAFGFSSGAGSSAGWATFGRMI